MKFITARRQIQSTVKESLEVSTSPNQASASAIRYLMSLMGFDEPYNDDQCNQIANRIVADVLKEQSAITVSQPADIESVGDGDNLSDLGLAPLPEVEHQNTTASIDVALVFSNNFEKASIIKTDLQSSDITISDTQAIEIAAKMPDTFESRLSFHNDVLSHWMSLRRLQGEIELDNISQKIADIEAYEYGLDNRIRQMYGGTVSRVATRREKLNRDVTQLITDVMNQ
jgi:hypothetical protein